MYQHVMLDIETLGRKSGCVITEIAAVPFDDLGTPYPESAFQANIDITTFPIGFHIDSHTLAWAIRHNVDILLPAAQPAPQVFANFAAWFRSLPPKVSVWAKSPSFDCDIVEGALRRFNQRVPWEYWQCRDVRTELRNEPRDTTRKTAHRALADALDQIADLRRKWQREITEYQPANDEQPAGIFNLFSK